MISYACFGQVIVCFFLNVDQICAYYGTPVSFSCVSLMQFGAEIRPTILACERLGLRHITVLGEEHCRESEGSLHLHRVPCWQARYSSVVQVSWKQDHRVSLEIIVSVMGKVHDSHIYYKYIYIIIYKINVIVYRISKMIVPRLI